MTQTEANEQFDLAEFEESLINMDIKSGDHWKLYCMGGEL